MIVASVASACLLGWRMTSEAPGAGAEQAATGRPLQVGMAVAHPLEAYAFNAAKHLFDRNSHQSTTKN